MSKLGLVSLGILCESKFSAKARTSESIDGANNETVVADKFATVFEKARSYNNACNNNNLCMKLNMTKQCRMKTLDGVYSRLAHLTCGLRLYSWLAV